MRKSKAKPEPKLRNHVAVVAAFRKAGAMRDRRKRREQERTRQEATFGW